VSGAFQYSGENRGGNFVGRLVFPRFRRADPVSAVPNSHRFPQDSPQDVVPAQAAVAGGVPLIR
jgi:hypothetical protein